MLSTMFSNDVRQTLDHFRRSVDQMFDNFYGQTPQNATESAGARAWTFSPVLESGWNDNFLNVRAILPGIAENDLNVSIQNNQLVIEGERKTPENFGKGVTTQLAYGKFYTAVMLPTGLDVDHVQCRLTQGILDIRIPVQEASKPKQIQIQAGEAQKAVSA
ncbi:MAG TPA: Hsp20/alpha crystallin family protein [Bryobacteraceae bacterium]|nr:Hsp20/alpha crystallin family protein [Bryobacteraceae bacterium]